ncbi:MAG: bifunctional UDP-N-acetylglucosamine diphosphorylase/glucosamine-1-phosphate N-acetyltransferase GlmU [Eggerthellaceae bacterium]|nr:bifunctional UDP-N-acetylglucosamine diphosphorylase/glucosamine-1-phosphate N-acetyltransferase GlmU [Eggerthellaceae bacterium]
MSTTVIILAAGAGTRMKSDKPKVAHEILAVPLVQWVKRASLAAGADDVITVVGHQREFVEPLVSDTKIAIQHERLGTGDAVVSAKSFFSAPLSSKNSVVVLSGDSPLIRPETIAALVQAREENDAAMSVLTMRLEDPTGYGRIIRKNGEVQSIVEQKDCTPDQAAITECNSGVYCFNEAILFDSLEKIDNNNAQGEYYLTDVLGICKQENLRVIAVEAQDATEALGVNSRKQLSEAAAILQERINNAHMAAGVTLWSPSSTFIGPDVRIEADVEILPQTMLLGKTSVGKNSVIGPNTRLTDTFVGKNCVVDETIALEARIDDGATSGPRAYLRPGAHLQEGAKAGTHVEIKKSVIGPESKVPHLSYIGDAHIGARVNIGAGTITCNYDGVEKHATHIGDDVFVGSDTMLVAPVSLGDRATIGAGSTITKDVESDALSLERNEQIQIEQWAKNHRQDLQK